MTQLQNSLTSSFQRSATPPGITTQPTAGQIHNALSYAEDRLSLLKELSLELERRLVYVLSPAGPTGAGAAGADHAKNGGSAPIAERLSVVNINVDNLISYLGQLIGRLEI